MALEIRKAEAAAVGIIADRRLYLTADKARVVEDGDPSAAFLFATPGVVIPAAEATALGLEVVDGRVQHRSAKVAEPPKVEPDAKPDEKPAKAKK